VWLWRVSDFVDLGGVGGTLANGRWHLKGPPVVYTAESSALALLEVLAGLEVGFTPADYQLLRIAAPEDLLIEEFGGAIAPGLAESRDWGRDWLSEQRTVLARVPSVVAPHSYNLLLNPRHADAARIRVVESARWPWDARLFR
jgi:RES domain-containing protein